MTNTKERNRAKEQARAQLDSIITMAKRLEHCDNCDGEDCGLTDQEILEGIGIYYNEGDTASEDDRKQYHDENKARESIEEDPLSILVRSDWHFPGSESEDVEYEILLCTGGPACRIVGELGIYSQPDNAEIQYQDWFTPWERYTETTSEEDEALLTYARTFYFDD